MYAQHGRHLYGESPEWGLASAYHSQEQGCPPRGGIRRKLEANARLEVHESNLRRLQSDESPSHDEILSCQRLQP